MDTNEAPTALLAGDNPSVADVFYCASLLRVSPAGLLGWVIKQGEPNEDASYEWAFGNDKGVHAARDLDQAREVIEHIPENKYRLFNRIVGPWIEVSS